MKRQGWALCIGMVVGGTAVAQPPADGERYPPAPEMPGVVISKPSGDRPTVTVTEMNVKPVTYQNTAPVLPAPTLTATQLPYTNVATVQVAPVPVATGVKPVNGVVAPAGKNVVSASNVAPVNKVMTPVSGMAPASKVMTPPKPVQAPIQTSNVGVGMRSYSQIVPVKAEAPSNPLSPDLTVPYEGMPAKLPPAVPDLVVPYEGMPGITVSSKQGTVVPASHGMMVPQSQGMMAPPMMTGGCATPACGGDPNGHGMGEFPSFGKIAEWFCFHSSSKQTGCYPYPYHPNLTAWFPCNPGAGGCSSCAMPSAGCASGHCGSQMIPMGTPAGYPVGMQMGIPAGTPPGTPVGTVSTGPVDVSGGPSIRPVYNVELRRVSGQAPVNGQTPANTPVAPQPDPLMNFKKMDGMSFTPGGSPMAAPVVSRPR
ncbi:hypothetical protein [Zavarzinella formosa]|uniref:hypothetical protein n=1 Tax=Zavarzinella formosa TaxID=360055 RepID=UPI00030231E8|nr:hypothetical protein [Zavarzinella formosa]